MERYKDNPGKGFKSIAEVKAKNKEIGNHWFDPGTMSFFRTRIESNLYAGRYFLTSELAPGHTVRRYSIRKAEDSGEVKTIGDFYRYETKRSALTMIRGIVRDEAKVQNKNRS